MVFCQRAAHFQFHQMNEAVVVELCFQLNMRHLHLSLILNHQSISDEPMGFEMTGKTKHSVCH